MGSLDFPRDKFRPFQAPLKPKKAILEVEGEDEASNY